MNARISADRNAAAEPAIRSVRFWTPIVVIAAALIGIVFVLDRPDARALAQQIKAEQIEQEDRALCGRIGKAQEGFAGCAAVLSEARQRHAERLAAEINGF